MSSGWPSRPKRDRHGRVILARRHRRLHRARRDRVDPHAVLRVSLRRPFHQGEDAALRAAVCGSGADAAVAARGGSDDDRRALAVASHRRQACLRTIIGPSRLTSRTSRIRSISVSSRPPNSAYAGAVDEHRQRPQLGLALGDRRRHRRLVDDAAAAARGAPARRRDLLGNRGRVGEVKTEDGGTGASEREGGGAADSGGRAGHERGPAGQVLRRCSRGSPSEVWRNIPTDLYIPRRRTLCKPEEGFGNGECSGTRAGGRR